MEKTVRTEGAERLDQSDFDAVSAYTDEITRRIISAIGASRYGGSDPAESIGVVLKSSTLVQGDPGASDYSLTLGSGLTLLLATSAGDPSEQPYGEIIELDSDLVLDDVLPHSTGTAYMSYILVRVSPVTEGDNAPRVFFDDFSPSKEVVKSINTRNNRTLEWKSHPTSGLAAEISNGWMLAFSCLRTVMEDPCTIRTFNVFPQARSATFPLGEFTSIAQVLKALAYEVGGITGTGWPLTSIPVTLLSAASKLTHLESNTHRCRIEANDEDVTELLQPIPPGVNATLVTWGGSAIDDPRGMLHADKDRIVIKQSGYYLFSGQITLIYVEQGHIILSVNNLTQTARISSGRTLAVLPDGASEGSTSMSYSGLLYCEGGDEVGVYIHHSMSSNAFVEGKSTINALLVRNS